MSAVYPIGRTARDRFVLDRRGPRQAADPWAVPRVTIDPEPDGNGGVVEALTIFLTGRECPWRCVMCDLWQHTTEADTPPGAIPAQIRAGLRAGPRPGIIRRHYKLYNAGSFFDPRAVPPIDDPAIADAVTGAAGVTVESHPRLIGDRTWRFRDRLAPPLEVAVGLETAHPKALARLNKGCGLDEFAAAADALAAHGVGLRVFLLVHPPFVPRSEQTTWLQRSVDAAIDAGASTIALIPTRGGSGAMPALAAQGAFDSPTLADVEASAALALQRAQQRAQNLAPIAGSGRGPAPSPAPGPARVLADLWDLAAFATCAACLDARQARLLRQNVEQRVPPSIVCAACGGGAPDACR